MYLYTHGRHCDTIPLHVRHTLYNTSHTVSCLIPIIILHNKQDIQCCPYLINKASVPETLEPAQGPRSLENSKGSGVELKRVPPKALRLHERQVGPTRGRGSSAPFTSYLIKHIGAKVHCAFLKGRKHNTFMVKRASAARRSECGGGHIRRGAGPPALRLV